jgi:hypothetical protein
MARNLYQVAIVMACAMLLALPGAASAAKAKKLSYEQAWAQCKGELGQNATVGEGLNTAGRHAAGGACMHKYGYRLKKSSSL